MNEYKKPLPKIREEVKEFWEGCKRHELLIQKCKDCGTYRFPPQLMCPECNSVDKYWSRVSGKGKVHSFIIVRRTKDISVRSPLRGFDYPYAVVLIELPDAGGVHIVSNMIDCEMEEIKIGMPVEVVFDDVSEEIALPKFRPSL